MVFPDLAFSWMKEMQYIIDNIDETDDIDDLLSSYTTDNYTNFNTFAQYLLGVDMTSTPRDLFWNLDTGKRDCLWEWLRELSPKLFNKIDQHIDSFNKRSL